MLYGGVKSVCCLQTLQMYIHRLDVQPGKRKIKINWFTVYQFSPLQNNDPRQELETRFNQVASASLCLLFESRSQIYLSKVCLRDDSTYAFRKSNYMCILVQKEKIPQPDTLGNGNGNWNGNGNGNEELGCR